MGHIIPLVGGDWSHDGIAEFFNAIQENGYQFIYLSARAIGQSQITRNFLKNIKQSDRELPSGPLLISPDTLMTALYRFVCFFYYGFNFIDFFFFYLEKLLRKNLKILKLNV